MEDQRKNELAVVIAATVVFGFMNRILIRIPYMVLGDFSFSFLISVVTWWIYNSVLFSVAEQMADGRWRQEKNRKNSLVWISCNANKGWN